MLTAHVLTNHDKKVNESLLGSSSNIRSNSLAHRLSWPNQWTVSRLWRHPSHLTSLGNPLIPRRSPQKSPLALTADLWHTEPSALSL